LVSTARALAHAHRPQPTLGVPVSRVEGTDSRRRNARSPRGDR
jgi:hypothetical protein